MKMERTVATHLGSMRVLEGCDACAEARVEPKCIAKCRCGAFYFHAQTKLTIPIISLIVDTFSLW